LLSVNAIWNLWFGADWLSKSGSIEERLMDIEEANHAIGMRCILLSNHRSRSRYFGRSVGNKVDDRFPRICNIERKWVNWWFYSSFLPYCHRWHRRRRKEFLRRFSGVKTQVWPVRGSKSGKIVMVIVA
jgi:hypothetical protein